MIEFLGSFGTKQTHSHLKDFMLYMILEHFKEGSVLVYRRFRDHGRLAPEGVRYVSSWVTQDLRHCYQVMDCNDP